MTAGQGAGEFPADLDPRTEVAALLAQLDRLFGHGGAHGAPVTGGNTGP